MEIKGRILKVLPERSGTSQRTGNPWKSLPFIIEFYENPTDRQADRMVLETSDEQYMELVRICGEHSGEPGYEVKCVIGHWVNEWNGNHYNSIRCYSVTAVGNIEVNNKPAEAPTPTPEQQEAMDKLNKLGESAKGEGDGMPF